MLSLAQHVEEHGPLTVKDAMGWVLRAAKTVTALHGDGKVHGSLCAAAIRIETTDCRGAGALIVADDVEQPACYRSLDREESGDRAVPDDVWALGVTLFYALTGVQPYPDGVTAFLSSGARELPTLAHHRVDLEVMQPFMDALIDPLDFTSTAHRFLAMIASFSPAIADLEGLPIHDGAGTELLPPPIEVPARTTSEAPDGEIPLDDDPLPEVTREAPPAEALASARSRGLLPAAAVVVLMSALLLGVLMWRDLQGKHESDDVDTPTGPGTAVPPRDPVPGPGVTTASTGDAARPSGVSSGDALVCMTPLLPPRLLRPTASVDYLCTEVDPKAWLLRTQQEIVRSTEGKATSASSEWSNLGWYQLAVLGLARGRCCATPAPAEVPVLLSPCKLAEALEALGHAGSRRSDRELVEGMEKFNEAAACLSMAGGGAAYGFEKPPGTQQAAIFLRTLKRVSTAE